MAKNIAHYVGDDADLDGMRATKDGIPVPKEDYQPPTVEEIGEAQRNGAWKATVSSLSGGRTLLSKETRTDVGVEEILMDPFLHTD